MNKHGQRIGIDKAEAMGSRELCLKKRKTMIKTDGLFSASG
jgi:hypothetical protein